VKAVSAIVLAGGRSSRFGTDKLAARIDGRPILDHVLEAVRAVADEIVLALPPQEAGTPDRLEDRGGVKVVHDREPFAGPLAGLAGALAAATQPTAIVVGGDMPRVRPAVLEAMLAVLEPGMDAVALGVEADVRPLPLALRVEPARAAVTSALERGDRSLRSLVSALETRVLSEMAWRRLDPEADTLVDVDRPADLERASGSFERADRPLR
jgi:molybdopterin-guanine dinucleotide biosynthesis protein A